MLLCCRSHRRFFRRDSVSSVESILRRVVRGESERAGGWMLVEVMMGLAWVASCGGIGKCAPGSGEVATEGPFGVFRPDLRIAGVEREAAFASALARSGSCIRLVRSERREVRLGLESTRWKSSLSLTEEDLL